MRSLKYLVIFIFFVSCGYTPIYQTDEISKFKLGIINHSGDKKIGRDLLNNLEANLIRTALDQTDGNVSKASELLQIGRTSLIQKINKYQLEKD